jgi:subtilisin family serine protease
MPSDAATPHRIRIAVVDSGVYASHPHVGGVVDGFAIGDDGVVSADFVDRLGHGTAVAAAIREKVPEAELLAVKVFWQSLATGVGSLVRAIDWASANGAHVINLSLGTREQQHRSDLAAAVTRARTRGAFVVSAGPDGDTEWLPGALDGVVPVKLDWSCDRDSYYVTAVNGRTMVAASGYPRDIPGVPRERNLKGVSFAVANASAFVARALEKGPLTGLDALFDVLRRDARTPEICHAP